MTAMTAMNDEMSGMAFADGFDCRGIVAQMARFVGRMQRQRSVVGQCAREWAAGRAGCGEVR